MYWEPNKEVQTALAYAYYQARLLLKLPENPETDWKEAEKWLIENDYSYQLSKEQSAERRRRMKEN